MAGRAFATGQPVSAERDGSARVWVPVVEQTTRTGVLAITVPQASPEILAQAELLGVFAGLAAAVATRLSDVPDLRRRERAMSLPASMQWDLLPPPSARTGGTVIAGVLEPAYDIAGDAFDYVVNGGDLHFAIIDGMGHGIGSTLLTGLAVGAYRHTRRGGATLPGIHAAIDEALAGYYGDLSFATGIIARLATRSGQLRWSCAGHPPPLLLRGRKVVAELSCEPALPFGLGDSPPDPSTEELQPDDAVLFYTDGVTEARTPTGSCSAWTGSRTSSSAKPPAASRPKRCCGAWCARCSTIRPTACVMTPPSCSCNGPAQHRLGCRHSLSSSPGTVSGRRRPRLAPAPQARH